MMMRVRSPPMHRRTAFEGKSPDGSSGWSLAAVRSQWIARRWGLSEKGFMGETAIIYLGPMNLSPLK